MFRLPLTEKKPAYHPLVFTGELNQALWPAYYESGARRDQRPALVRLPTGEEVQLEYAPSIAQPSESPLPMALSKWLIAERAQAGDDLLFRVVDVDARLYEVQLQRRSKRDEQAIARRNRQIADAAYDAFRYVPEGRKLISEVSVTVMAQGSIANPYSRLLHGRDSSRQAVSGNGDGLSDAGRASHAGEKNPSWSATGSSASSTYSLREPDRLRAAEAPLLGTAEPWRSPWWMCSVSWPISSSAQSKRPTPSSTT